MVNLVIRQLCVAFCRLQKVGLRRSRKLYTINSISKVIHSLPAANLDINFSSESHQKIDLHLLFWNHGTVGLLVFEI